MFYRPRSVIAAIQLGCKRYRVAEWAQCGGGALKRSPSDIIMGEKVGPVNADQYEVVRKAKIEYSLTDSRYVEHLPVTI